LVVRAAAGDAQAFADLLDPLVARLRLFLRFRGRDVLGADCDEDDLLQQALAHAWRLMPELDYRGPAPFYRWLVALAEGVVRDRLKYVRAKGRDAVRHVESNPARLEPAAEATSVAGRAARAEAHQRLAAALAALDEPSHALVRRHLLDGATLAELAAELGVTKNAVWERVQRALARLRDVLEPPA
jgi:RNA polymerase sigma-70 factor (ECF subfamily)